MHSNSSTRIFLFALAAMFIPYGVYCFLSPEFLAEAAGVTAVSATGTTELRAMYGGLQTAIGLLLLVGAMNSHLRQAALAAVAFVLPGLAASRLLGTLIDGDIGSYTIAALIFEIGSSTIALFLYLRQQDPSALRT